MNWMKWNVRDMNSQINGSYNVACNRERAWPVTIQYIKNNNKQNKTYNCISAR